MENFKDKFILITGGAGAIGSNLVKKLSQEGARIIVLDNLSSSREENIAGIPNVQFINGSITDDVVLEKIFSRPIDYVFHLAASFANQRSVDDPLRDLDVNGAGTIKLLQHSVKNGNIKRFIFSSSSCVYGNVDGIINENTAVHPETPYAVSKLAAENYVNFFHKYYGLKVSILRYFNSYGPGEHPGKYRNIIPNFFSSAMSGLPLQITGTGEESRNFTFVDDVVDVTIKSAIEEKAVGECFNIGFNKEVRIKDLAEKINGLTGNKAGVSFIERRKWDTILKRIPNCEKAKKLLDFNPKIEIDRGLEFTYKWFLNNQENING